MNTKQLEYVLTLSREGTFSRAADVLNITQPSLSQYIKKIEKEVGLPLFDRTNGDVRLTDAGRVYVETGRRILDLEHQMENEFTDLAVYKTGSLIIGAAPYRAASMMPAVVSAFHNLHPGIKLIIREGTTAELVEGMKHGEYDLALTLLPIDEREFSCEKVVEEELVLAVPASHPPFQATNVPDRKYPAIDPKLLLGIRFVTLTETQYMQRQLQEMLVNHNVSVETVAIVKSLQAQIEMVKAGVGMALVPSGIERFCTNDDVTFYSILPELPKRQVVVMWRKERKLSAMAEELKNVIQSIKW